MNPTNRRRRVFVAMTAACVLAGAAYVAVAATRSTDTPNPGSNARAQAALERTLSAPGAAPQLLFQHVARDGAYSRVALANAEGGGRRVLTGLTCERVHFGGRRGLCLLGRQGVTGPEYTVKLFERDLRVRHELELTGLLSRARVSQDGRYGATTAFVVGHSYADPGEFSTHTVLIDMIGGRRLADLEDFTVVKDGRRIRAVDVNYWGVTFAPDGDRFYATLRTSGRTYLIEGDIPSRRARVLYENVECPSLSPDGTRIAYKKRVDEGSVIWRLHVLDLATMSETPLAEPRMVDDQVEWLDDGRILYGLDGETWVVPADGSGAARRFLPDALSPAVVRST